MLGPRERTLLLEALRPPIGYRLDRAVATTYTLDLVALLTAPLAFTYFDAHGSDERPATDPLALLEALRRNADRIHVFCEAGAIHPPRPNQRLLTQLEDCVVEVTAPQGGVFHPKLWLLRFAAKDLAESGGGDEPVRYRLVVGTRNLTFDRSWDTALVLEGVPGGGDDARERNAPLERLLRALPSMAVRDVDWRCREAVEGLADDLGGVVWTVPQDFSEEGLAFHVFGIGEGSSPWPFRPDGRRLVMAPFVDEGFLRRFENELADNVVISRPESLTELADGSLGGFGLRYVLAAEADPEEGGEEDTTPEAPGEDFGPAADPTGAPEPEIDEIGLTGLHAKLFVLERFQRALVFTGSANATIAAFEKNVEILVELDGGRWKRGIQALIADRTESKAGILRDLLMEWTPPEEREEPDLERRKLEREVDAVRDAIARAELEVAGGPLREDGTIELSLRGTWPASEHGFAVRCWPSSLPASHAVSIEAEPGRGAPLATFTTALESATAFFVFEVIGRRGSIVHKACFARRLPLSGMPEDRSDRLLRSLLRDKETVLRLLFLLLSAEELTVAQVQALSGQGTGDAGQHLQGGIPLLEALVRAVERGPETIEPVRKLVADLSRTPEGRDLLPDGFEEIWRPLVAACEELAR